MISLWSMAAMSRSAAIKEENLPLNQSSVISRVLHFVVSSPSDIVVDVQCVHMIIFHGLSHPLISLSFPLYGMVSSV